MKIIKKLTAAALAACIALSFSAAAHTMDGGAGSTTSNDFFISDNSGDIESKVNVNELVHWSDVLGYGIETVQNELAENHPSESAHGENRISPYGNETIGTFTKEELEEMGAWEIGMGSYEPYTSEEAEFIIDRLLEIKEPKDSIAFDHGDIYLDIRWRGKTISLEGFPSYMPY